MVNFHRPSHIQTNVPDMYVYGSIGTVHLWVHGYVKIKIMNMCMTLTQMGLNKSENTGKVIFYLLLLWL